MSVLIVDWLGRGGIAHTTEAWVLELEQHGIGARVVTRPGRELAGLGQVTEAAPRRGRIAAHRAVVTTATAAILDERPAWVVVQNYVLPFLEAPVLRTAQSVGARTVLVVHDHRLQARSAGTAFGLAANIWHADVVVAHSEFVATAIARTTGRSDVTVVPHPAYLGMARREALPPSGIPDDALLALHFGVLRRRYKGTTMVRDLVGSVPGWHIGALGAGAPAARDGLTSVPGYVESDVLCGMVTRADAALLPYRYATQSGAVVLAQMFGAVPVVSAVGGIPEQVTDGVDGVLMPRDGLVGEWRAALGSLSDDDVRKGMATAASERVWHQHAQFVDWLGGLAS